MSDPTAVRTITPAARPVPTTGPSPRSVGPPGRNWAARPTPTRPAAPKATYAHDDSPPGLTTIPPGRCGEVLW